MSAEVFLSGKVQLCCGDSLHFLKDQPDNRYDSIVTDPPYALASIQKRYGAENSKPSADVYGRGTRGFMGKQWDTGETAFAIEFWQECLRVLKPGGHVVAFGGTRTYHRLACAIEDAGFEIRDCAGFLYGSGFPKSHNISRKLNEQKECCSCATDLQDLRDDMDSKDALSGGSQQNMRSSLRSEEPLEYENGEHQEASHILRQMRGSSERPAAIEAPEASDGLLQSLLPSQGSRKPSIAVRGKRKGKAVSGEGIAGSQKSSMEGRGDVPEAARKLCEHSLRSVPARADGDGEDGRLRDGASVSDGEVGGQNSDSDRVRPPSGSQATQQSTIKSRTVAGQPKPQVSGAWENCRRCGKPLVPDGLGTALKPAMELICLARKPLSEKTVAANVLRWRCGALNIDASRIAAPDGVPRFNKRNEAAVSETLGNGLNGSNRTGEMDTSTGRWPANVLHDGSDEVLAQFPDRKCGDGTIIRESGSDKNGNRGSAYGAESRPAGTQTPSYGDDGSAARFFYTAKADADDRLGSKHPTVKPVDLIQWLVRLVTPKGGLVLDPFAGTGTTAEACFREGMRCMLVEREAEYQADIRRRMGLVLGGPEERRRESIKAKTKDQPIDAGPLFGGCV